MMRSEIIGLEYLCIKGCDAAEMLLICTAKPDGVFTSGGKNKCIRKFYSGFYGIFFHDLKSVFSDNQHYIF